MSADLLSPDAPSIPFPLAASFFRLLAHDVRNGLNAIDLQSAFIAEIATDQEVIDEVKKIRVMSANVARLLQNTALYFQPILPRPITISAKLLLEDLRDRLARAIPDPPAPITWVPAYPDEAQQVTVDLELFSAAAIELIKNAFHFHEAGREIRVDSGISGGEFCFLLEESKAKVEGEPEQWGTIPLQSTRRGGYGLGLFHARRIVAAHGGALTIHFDGARSLLQTRVSIPQMS